MRPDRLYFFKPIGQPGPIKIGCSRLPDNRLAECAAWSPIPLELIGTLPGTLEDEAFLHDCFIETRSHKEWFHFTPELDRAIKVAIAAQGVEPLRLTLQVKGNLRRLRNYRPRPPAQALYFSYSVRVRWAEKRLERRAPKDVQEILRKWSGRADYRTPSLYEMPDGAIALLDKYLADPAAYAAQQKATARVGRPPKDRAA